MTGIRTGMASHKLSTKADTLRMLYSSLEHAKVLPQFSFTVGEFTAAGDKVMEAFEALEWKRRVIVRSSALNEDRAESSMAGKYESVMDVSGSKMFEEAVCRVISSYDDNNPDNQILVQPMLEKVNMSGVAFTLDPNTLGNYYVVNYDETGSTSSVTAGETDGMKLYYRFKSHFFEGGGVNPAGYKSDEMDRLCAALHELENFFGQNNLDVEFAFTEDGSLYVLQVRSLCIRRKPLQFEQQQRALMRIEEKIRSSQTKKPFLCGTTTIYSVMTDWNPAEMIGIRPKPLALSLYREIITDSVWAYQRDNYGYRNLRSYPLMVDFEGLPYIDVRVSFNSFVPSGLEEELSEKLVDYYLAQLAKRPQDHDKAEFEIVFSCYTLDLPERIMKLRDNGFPEEEIERIVNALRDVTNQIIDFKHGLWRKDYKKIEILNSRYNEIVSSDMSRIEKIYWLLEDCKRYGTLPFAGLARAAFIAVQMLKSFVSCGILSQCDYEAFMNEVDTTGSAISRDFEELSRDSFLKKYGHLRPGTYDITSLRYDEAPELYFGKDNLRKDNTDEAPEKSSAKFRLSLKQLNALKDILEKNRLSNDVLDIMLFIKKVIEGREYGKFAFTRNLSMALRLLGDLGMEQGISREDCAFINIRAVYELYASTGSAGDIFKKFIAKGKNEYMVTESVTLPPVIISPGDVTCFYYPDSEPNFITSHRVYGEPVLIEAGKEKSDIEGKIVLIASADPGYDWIFSCRIKGFVTMFGGANSHMAIRAGELDIPAAIGVGMARFNQYCAAETIEIDTLSKIIRVLK